MTQDRFWKMQREIGWEFSRYLITHPEAERKIPPNAQIIFQLKNNREFNEWSRKISKKQCEPGQPIVMVHIEKLIPPLETRIVNPLVEVVSG